MLVPGFHAPGLHVAISLAAITSGFFVLFGVIGDERLDRFLSDGYGGGQRDKVRVPFKGTAPGIAFGIISLGVLAVLIDARYPAAWRASGVACL